MANRVIDYQNMAAANYREPQMAKIPQKGRSTTPKKHSDGDLAKWTTKPAVPNYSRRSESFPRALELLPGEIPDFRGRFGREDPEISDIAFRCIGRM